MTTRYLSLLFFFLTLFLSTACRHDSRTGRILDQADSLLATRPDSALPLLERHADRLPPHSTRECARYALLLARALDKCEQPLEPCDSLLDAALACYDSRSPERPFGLSGGPGDRRLGRRHSATRAPLRTGQRRFGRDCHVGIQPEPAVLFE